MLSCFTSSCIFVRSLRARRVRWRRHPIFWSLGPRVWPRPGAGMITWWIFCVFRFHRPAPWLTSSTTFIAAVPFTGMCSLSSIIRGHTSRVWPATAFIRPRTTRGTRAFPRSRCVIVRGRPSWRVTGPGVRVLVIIAPFRSLVVSGVVIVVIARCLVCMVFIVGRSAVVRVADTGPGVSGGHGSLLWREGGSGRGRGRRRLVRGVLRLSSWWPAVPRAARGAIRGHTFA